MTTNRLITFLDVRRGTITQDRIGTYKEDLDRLQRDGLIAPRPVTPGYYLTSVGENLYEALHKVCVDFLK